MTRPRVILEEQQDPTERRPRNGDQAEEALTSKGNAEKFPVGELQEPAKGLHGRMSQHWMHPPREHEPWVITVPGQLDIAGPSCILPAHREGPKAAANGWESTGDQMEPRKGNPTVPCPSSAACRSEAFES